MCEIKTKVLSQDQESRPKKWIGVRHLQYFLMFFSIIMLYGQRTNLSVAIVAMTDKTQNSTDNIPIYHDWTNTDTILSSFFWGYITSQVGAGKIVEYFGVKWFLGVAIIISSILNIVTPMAAKTGQNGVIYCRVFQGLNQGFLYPSVHTILTQWTPIYERTRVSSVVYGGSSLGTAFSMLISGAIAASSLGWPSIFYIYGGAGIIWGVIFILLIANKPEQHRSISEEEKKYIESSTSVNRGEKKVATPWKSIALSLPVWSIFLNTCAQSWGTFTLLTEIPSFLSNMMKYELSDSSALSALPYFVMFLMSFVGAPISDVLISRKILSIGSTRKIINSIGTFVPGIALIGLGFLRDKSQKDTAVALLVVTVGVSSFINAGSLVNIIDIAPNHAGTLMGLINGGSQIASILGPLTVGFLGGHKEDPNLWKSVFWIAAGVYIGGGIIFAVFSKGEIQKWNDVDER